MAFDPSLIDTDDVAVPDLDLEVRRTPVGDLSSLSLGRPPTTIVVLGYTAVGTDEADSRTLLGVMELRRRFSIDHACPRLVVQLLDAVHLDLAVLTGPDDFLVSGALGSQLIAQLFEQPERRGVLLELYSGDGPSIRMVPCGRLDLVGERTMAEIIARAFASGLLAIGWRRSVALGSQLVLNPEVSDHITLAPDDEIVVIG